MPFKLRLKGDFSLAHSKPPVICFLFKAERRTLVRLKIKSRLKKANMQKHAENTTENNSLAVANSLLKKQDNEKTSFQLVDNRRESAAQAELQTLINNSSRVKRTVQFQALANGQSTQKAPVQRMQKEATVTWDITHIVQSIDNSLFGADEDPLANELPPDLGGELKAGDQLIIDDAPVMISRRGANQENPEKRAADKDGDKGHEWVRVLRIIHPDRAATIFEDQLMYVRKETIVIREAAPLPVPQQLNDIELQNIANWDAENMPEQLGQIALLWGRQGRLKRSRSAGVIETNKADRGDRDKGSGRFWEQEDDGWDVALDMAHEGHQKFSADKRQWRIKAVMRETGALVGVLIVEEQQDNDLYLRWMIGNPEIKGGGSALLSAVKILLQQSAGAKIEVTSAYTAKDTYTKAGFNSTNPDEDADKQKGEEFELVLMKDDPVAAQIPARHQGFQPAPYPLPGAGGPYRGDKPELDEIPDLEAAMRALLPGQEQNDD